MDVRHPGKYEDPEEGEEEGEVEEGRGKEVRRRREGGEVMEAHQSSSYPRLLLTFGHTIVEL